MCIRDSSYSDGTTVFCQSSSQIRIVTFSPWHSPTFVYSAYIFPFFDSSGVKERRLLHPDVYKRQAYRMRRKRIKHRKKVIFCLKIFLPSESSALLSTMITAPAVKESFLAYINTILCFSSLSPTRTSRRFMLWTAPVSVSETSQQSSLMISSAIEIRAVSYTHLVGEERTTQNVRAKKQKKGDLKHDDRRHQKNRKHQHENHD